MGNIGFGELLLILLVLVLVFGTSRLPALGDALGRGIRNFKRAKDDGKTPPGPQPGAPPR